MKRILKISTGFTLILIGIIGLILPVMPGWVFIIPGLVILAEYSRLARRLLHWAKARAEQVTGRPWGKEASPPDRESSHAFQLSSKDSEL